MLVGSMSQSVVSTAYSWYRMTRPLIKFTTECKRTYSRESTRLIRGLISLQPKIGSCSPLKPKKKRDLTIYVSHRALSNKMQTTDQIYHRTNHRKNKDESSQGLAPHQCKSTHARKHYMHMTQQLRIRMMECRKPTCPRDVLQ